MSVSPFIALLFVTAHAVTPLVVEGEDVAAAARAVSERTGLPPSQLEPLDIGTLLEKPPQVVGHAVLRRCVGDPSGMEPVRAELARAAMARQAGDSVGSLDHLDLAVAALGCLSELVESSVAAQVFLQRGAVLAAQGDLDAARSELRTALSFEQGLAWDASLPSGAEQLLDDERDPAERFRVQAAPSGLVSGPWLGGRLVEAEGLEVAGGLLLAQYSSPAGIRSAWMVISGDASLLIPSAYHRPVLRGMVQADTRSELASLLEATLPDFIAAYVHHSAWGTWLVVGEDEGPRVSELVPPTPPEEPQDQERRWWRRRR